MLHDARPMKERFLDLLPLDGKPLFYGELMRRARELHLNAGQAGSVLVLLCSERLAVSEMRDSHQFVRRLPAHAEVVPLPRPRIAATRLHATDRPRAGTLVKRAAGWG